MGSGAIVGAHCTPYIIGAHVDNIAHALAGAALGQAGLEETERPRRRHTGDRRQHPGHRYRQWFRREKPRVAARMDARADRADRAARSCSSGDDRVRPLASGARIAAADKVTGPRPGLLPLACIGVLSHPVIDLLNVYGVRLLMPFSERWFYGDALFIIDIWVWLLFALGIRASRRREQRNAARPGRPALAAIAAVTIDAVAMAAAERGR